MRADINFKQDWGADYDAKNFFESLGLKDIRFEWKRGTGKADGVLFIKMIAVDTLDGQYIDKDLWPVYDFPTETVDALVKNQPKNFVLRRGEHVDETTGEPQYSMKWVTIHMDKSPIAGGVKRPGFGETN